MRTFKQLLLSLSIILITSASLNAQKVYQPEDITPQLLSEHFDAALMDVIVVEEDYIKVRNVYEYFVDIDPKKRYVSFSATYSLDEKAQKNDILEFLNLINKEVAMITAYTNENHSTITYIYYFWTDGGYTAKSLVSSLKLVDAALNLSLEKDTKGLL